MKSGSQPDEFYVGYLKTPPGNVRFLTLAAPLVVLGALVIGVLVIRSHNNPGSGAWDTETLRGFEGVIDTRPYPMIWVPAAEGVDAILLVSEGKFGAKELSEKFEGRPVRVRGTLLERDGRRMIELESSDQAIEGLQPSQGGVRSGRPKSVELGLRTLRGEIIDPKCYLGAMKPGEGKVHKECATLCISGGIPPMFLTRGADGRKEYYLLADAAGKAVSDKILPYVADPVELDGIVEKVGALLLVKIDPAKIRRL